MSLKEIQSELHSLYINRQLNDKKQAEKNLEYARSNKKFNINYLKINELNYIIAKKKNDKIDTSKEECELKQLNEDQQIILKKIGLSPQNLQVNYLCKLCQDSGFVKGVPCRCYKAELTKRLLKSNGIDYKNLKTFNDFDCNVASDSVQSSTLAKVKKVGEDFVKKFHQTKIETIYIHGATGTGKTFLTECIASALIRKYIYVNILSAFQMNNVFLNYHGSFEKDKSDILSALLDPDLLIIDDLGTEPMFKNVTREYISVVINERTLHHKKTIITSNLSPRDVLDRYGERIYSRLFSKNNSLQISLNGEDLRVKNI